MSAWPSWPPRAGKTSAPAFTDEVERIRAQIAAISEESGLSITEFRRIVNTGAEGASAKHPAPSAR